MAADGPLSLLATLYPVKVEDIQKIWEIMESSIWSRQPVERLRACEDVCRILRITGTGIEEVAELIGSGQVAAIVKRMDTISPQTLLAQLKDKAQSMGLPEPRVVK